MWQNKRISWYWFRFDDQAATSEKRPMSGKQGGRGQGGSGQQATLEVEIVKQYCGLQTVSRRVRVQVPGKHFPALQPAEKREQYWGEAVEFAERHDFPRHLQAWGGPHKGPGIRFICNSDALDDPDHKGFWTTTGLWSRWRHETYKNDREAE